MLVNTTGAVSAIRAVSDVGGAPVQSPAVTHRNQLQPWLLLASGLLSVQLSQRAAAGRR